MTLGVVAEAVLVVFGLFLGGLATVALARPAIAERFFSAFASSAANGVELVLGARLVQAPLPGDRAEGLPRGRRR